MGILRSYVVGRFMWQQRRRWTQQANAQDRAAKLAAHYTPRELRTQQQDYDLDRSYRLARDAMLDALDAGFNRDVRGAQQIEQGLAAMSEHRVRFGVQRYAELQSLLAQVKQLPTR
jgi:hypothetical protein